MKEGFKTIGEMVRYIEKNYDCPEALNYQKIDGENWDCLSTQTFIEEVRFLALGLRNLGLVKGDKVGLMANSSPRWTITDLAIICAGGVTVPLFANISEENFEYEIKQTELKHIFVAGAEQWEMFRKHENLFQTTISLYDEDTNHKAFRYEEVIEQGKSLQQKEPSLFDQLLDEQKSDDLATIVYTSGSTGFPKGAMLTHYNCVGLVDVNPFDWNNEQDSYLSLLPLAHIFARALNFIMISWGIPVWYIRDIKTVGDVCREKHPTIVVLVPRILEKIYAKMVGKVQEAGFLKRTLAQWAFELASQEEESWYKQLMHPLADAVVYSSLREALGGKLRVVICGGAALNPHLYHFFVDIGVPLFEGWGLTEAATVCCNRIDGIKIGTVGPPFDGMSIKTAEDGEVLVKGAIVMQGYYKNEVASKDAFTEDGWLRTGDKGKIDEDGYLTILGRLKEMYKSSTGEYIAPVPIEQEMCKAPLIDMAMVVADKRKYATILLFPDFDVVKGLKIAHNMEKITDTEFLESDFVKKEMKKLLKRVNEHHNDWEKIVDYRFIVKSPSIDNGELTPTMKIRRDFVEEMYRDIIESMYTEEIHV